MRLPPLASAQLTVVWIAIVASCASSLPSPSVYIPTPPRTISISVDVARPGEVVLLKGTSLFGARANLFASFGGRLAPALVATEDTVITYVPPTLSPGRTSVTLQRFASEQDARREVQNQSLTQAVSDVWLEVVDSFSHDRAEARGRSADRIAQQTADLVGVIKVIALAATCGATQRPEAVALREQLFSRVEDAVQRMTRLLSAVTHRDELDRLLAGFHVEQAMAEAVGRSSTASCFEARLAANRLWGQLAWLNAALGLVETAALWVDVLDSPLSPGPDVALFTTALLYVFRAAQSALEVLPLWLDRMEGTPDPVAVSAGERRLVLLSGHMTSQISLATLGTRLTTDFVFTALGATLGMAELQGVMNRAVLALHEYGLDLAKTWTLAQTSGTESWRDTIDVDLGVTLANPEEAGIAAIGGILGVLAWGGDLRAPSPSSLAQTRDGGVASVVSVSPLVVAGGAPGQTIVTIRTWWWVTHDWARSLSDRVALGAILLTPLAAAALTNRAQLVSILNTLYPVAWPYERGHTVVINVSAQPGAMQSRDPCPQAARRCIASAAVPGVPAEDANLTKLFVCALADSAERKDSGFAAKKQRCLWQSSPLCEVALVADIVVNKDPGGLTRATYEAYKRRGLDAKSAPVFATLDAILNACKR